MASTFETVTRQQALKYLNHLKRDNDASMNNNKLIHFTEQALKAQRAEILSNKIYFDEDGVMRKSIQKSYFEILQRLTMCQIIRLAINELPFEKEVPTISTKQYSSSAEKLLKTFEIESSPIELDMAEKLFGFYPDMRFWEQVRYNNSDLNLKSIEYFMYESGGFLLRTEFRKYSV